MMCPEMEGSGRSAEQLDGMGEGERQRICIIVLD